MSDFNPIKAPLNWIELNWIELSWGRGKWGWRTRINKVSIEGWKRKNEIDYIGTTPYFVILTLRPSHLDASDILNMLCSFSPHNFISALPLCPSSSVLQFLGCDGKLSSQCSGQPSPHVSGFVPASACLPILPAAYESYNRLPVMPIKNGAVDLWSHLALALQQPAPGSV